MRYQKLYFFIQLAESIIDDKWVCHITFSAWMSRASLAEYRLSWASHNCYIINQKPFENVSKVQPQWKYKDN